MSLVSPPARILFLDLRSSKISAPPAIAGLQAIEPALNDSECQASMSALAVLVAIDSLAAYENWQQRYHPMCAKGFPHVILLDPYCPALARRVLDDDTTDCCAMTDIERLELIVYRLQNRSVGQQPSSEGTALLLRMQTSFDTLPSPIFIKDRNGRYIACNKAFEEYLGLPRAQIVGGTVYDVAPMELARIYEKADSDLMAQGGTQIYEACVRYADGSYRDVVFHKSVFFDATGQPDGISGAMLDISDRKLLEAKLALAASTDFLTGINNLRTFYELGGQEFRHFGRSGRSLSLVIMDIDFFKEINDNLGHAAGDDALKQFVGVVQGKLREQDIFARAGGDEFRLLLPDTEPAHAHLVAERIRQSVNQIRVTSESGYANLSMSAGICSCLPGDTSLDDAVRRADAALYKAKAAGRNCVSPQFLEL